MSLINFSRSAILLLLMVLFNGCKNKSVLNSPTIFTGQIEYAYTYTSDRLPVDSLRKIKPHKSIFRYDSSNYQSQFLGKDTITYFYQSSINKCLASVNGRYPSECEDYSVYTDSIVTYKVYDTTELVLGQKCMVLEFQGKYFWNRYYVSKEFSIAPDTYKNHNAYNWKFYGDKTNGGLILKLEHRFKNYIMTGVVTNLKPFEKSEKAFTISSDVISAVCN